MSEAPSSLFGSTERVRPREPIARYRHPETSEPMVSIMGIELPVYTGKQGSFFHDHEFENFSLDEASVDLLKRYALTAALDQPILVEGETDVGKTKALEYLTHLCNRRLYRLSLSGQTDVTEFIGKYVPNTEDARATFERLLAQREKLSDASREIIARADESVRGLTEEECRQIAQHEGLSFDQKIQWVWQDGIIIKAMRHDNGRGAWLYLDELGAAEPQILVKINRIFEKYGRLEITENGNRMVEAGPDFRLFASTNPPEYAGREPFAPDFLRRWVYQKLGGLTKENLAARLTNLFTRQRSDTARLMQDLGMIETRPLDLKRETGVAKALVSCLSELIEDARGLLAAGTIAKDQKQRFRFEYSDLERVHDYLLAFGGNDPLTALCQAVEFYFAGKMNADADRKEIHKTLELILKTLKTANKIAAARGQKFETPEEVAMRERLKNQFSGAVIDELTPKPPAPTPPSPEPGIPFSSTEKPEVFLSKALNKRAKLFKKKITFKLKPPTAPKELTPSHLERLKAHPWFTGFQSMAMPRLAELHDLSEDYLAMMFPEKQRAFDTEDGLTSHRPDWWDQDALADWGLKPDGKPYTLGEVYVRSMKKELSDLGGSLLLVDSATKPNYVDGKQHYGSTSGSDPSLDPLLPLFKEVFGTDANRFNHSWNDLETRLLPRAKKELQKLWPDLPPSSFDVILVPFTVENLRLTFQDHPSSSTNCYQQTGTKAIKPDNSDIGRRLLAGYSDHGGAGCANGHAMSNARGDNGCRLAVVFRH